MLTTKGTYTKILSPLNTYFVLTGFGYFWLYQPGESVTILCSLPGDYIIWRDPDGEVIVNTTVSPAFLDINPTDSSHGDLYICQGITIATGAIETANVNFFAVSKCTCTAVFHFILKLCSYWTRV